MLKTVNSIYATLMKTQTKSRHNIWQIGARNNLCFNFYGFFVGYRCWQGKTQIQEMAQKFEVFFGYQVITIKLVRAFITPQMRLETLNGLHQAACNIHAELYNYIKLHNTPYDEQLAVVHTEIDALKYFAKEARKAVA